MSGLVTIGEIRLRYDHIQDITGILEVYVLDVYNFRAVRDSSLVLDLGAGIGDFAVAAGKQLGSRGRVLAIEPNPDDFQILSDNIRANGLRNVVPLNCALGETERPLTLSFKGKVIATSTWTLDRLLREAGLSADSLRDRPVSLKIDVEGAEVEVLRALNPLLRNVKSIALELHGTQRQVDALLGPMGFVFARLTRKEYLRNSLKFVLRHPRSAWSLWRVFRTSPGFHGLKGILGGIEISSSEQLAVGRYERVRS